MSTLSEDIREIVQELRDHRELLTQMTKRDLLLRYKQTAMGIGWAIFMPLVNTAVFSVVFIRVAPLDAGVPYPLFAYCGLWSWNLLASSLRFAVTSLTSNPNLVTKVYFPREIFPFSAMAVCLVDFAVGSIVLFAMMAWYHVSPGIHVLWLPIVLVTHLAFTAGVALIVAMANLFYRDVKYLFEVVLTVWMFATSVVYPIQLIGGRLGAVLALNPMTPIIDGYRSALLRNQSPITPAFAAAAVLSAAVLAIAWVTFHRAEYSFAENV